MYAIRREAPGMACCILPTLVACLISVSMLSLPISGNCLASPNSLASAAKLNADGGYEITLAIQTDQDLADSVGYLANVKVIQKCGLELASEQ